MTYEADKNMKALIGRWRSKIHSTAMDGRIDTVARVNPHDLTMYENHLKRLFSETRIKQFIDVRGRPMLAGVSLAPDPDIDRGDIFVEI